MGDVSSPQYPQPQAQPQNALSGDPSKVIGMIGQLNANALFQQQFNARKAIGQAYQGAIGDDGSIDTQKLMQGIKDNPDAGFMAGEAAQGALSRQGQQIENATKMFGLQAGQNKVLMDGIGSLASKPTISDEDLRNFAVTSARNSGVPTSTILSVIGSAPKDQKARHEWVQTIQNMAIGSAGVAQRVAAPPSSTGAPQQQPLGAANYGSAAPVGLAPGVGGAMEESQKSLVEDQKGSARTIANLRNLDIALPLVEKLGNSNFGPGSPEFAKLKASAITAGIIDPKTSDATVRQEVGKYLLKYATMAQNAGRSDQALGAALGSNPNLDLTQPANLGLIKNQIGLDKMDAALPKIFKAEHPGEDERSQYNQYKSDYYDRFDRRVFSFDKMSPEERRDVVQSLGGKNSAAYKKFDQTYRLAKQTGVIVPEKQ